MTSELREELANRAWLYDDPDAFLAGVDAALARIEARASRSWEDTDRAG
ncbi:hypothetical protein [Egibacter rhizosphaerae]|nr:hypothetical protein [Egibacter rhizosphaerae]